LSPGTERVTGAPLAVFRIVSLAIAEEGIDASGESLHAPSARDCSFGMRWGVTAKLPIVAPLFVGRILANS